MQSLLQEVISQSCRRIVEDCSYVAVNKNALGLEEDLPSKLKVADVFVTPYTCDPLPRDDGQYPDCGTTIEIAQGAAATRHANKLDAALMGGCEIRLERIALFAGAGFGKTMVLNRIALFLANQVDDAQYTEGSELRDDLVEHTGGWLNLDFFAGRCPLVIRCRDLMSDGLCARELIKAMFPDYAKTKSGPELDAIASTIRGNSQAFTIIVDGLDELPVSSRDFFEALEVICPLDPGYASSYIFSCRDVHRDNGIDDAVRDHHFVSLRLRALNELRDDGKRLRFIRQAALNWYSAQLPRDLDKAQRKSGALATLIMQSWSERFSVFLKSPLDLAVLFTLYSDTESLPTNSHELYSRYIVTKLRWRRSRRAESCGPEDAILALSFCAARMALRDGVPSSFSLSVPVPEFMKYLRASYSRLNGRILSPSDRGLSREEAARVDFDDMVYLHGILTISPNGEVGFEHRVVQDYLVANAIVTKAAPRTLCERTASEIVSRLSNDGFFDDDWIGTTDFIALDARVTRGELDTLCAAIAKATNPGHVSSQAARMFVDIINDRRLGIEDYRETTQLLFQRFFSRSITDTQLPFIRNLALDRAYARHREMLEKLYRDSCDQGYYYYSLPMGCIPLFETAKDDEVDDGYRIDMLSASLRGRLDSDFFLVLHVMDMISWLKDVRFPIDDEIKFVKHFLEPNGSRERLSFTESFESRCGEVFLHGSAPESIECVRVLNSLRDCGLPMCVGEASTKDTLRRCLLLYQDLEDGEWESGFVRRSKDRLFEFVAHLDVSWKDALGSEEAISAASLVGLENKIARAEEAANDPIVNSVAREQIASVILNARHAGAMADAEVVDLGDKLFDSGRRMHPYQEANTSLERLYDLYKKLRTRYAIANTADVARRDLEDWEPSGELEPGSSFFLSTGGATGLCRYVALKSVHSPHDNKDYVYYERAHFHTFGERTSGETLEALADGLNEGRFQSAPINTDLCFSRYYPDQVALIRKRRLAGGSMVLDSAFAKPDELTSEEITQLFFVAFMAPTPKAQEFSFIAIDEGGRRMKCDALFLFELPETGKSYIVYTDHSIDEEGNTKVYASAYNPNDLKSVEGTDAASLSLIPIETDREWDAVESLLDEMQGSDSAPDEAWDGYEYSNDYSTEGSLSPVELFEAGRYAEAISSSIHLVQAYPSSNTNRTNLAFLLRFCADRPSDFPKNEKYTIRELLAAGVRSKEPFALLNMALYELECGELQSCVELIMQINPSNWRELTDSFWHRVLWTKLRASEGALACALAHKLGDCDFEDWDAIWSRAFCVYRDLFEAIEKL